MQILRILISHRSGSRRTPRSTLAACCAVHGPDLAADTDSCVGDPRLVASLSGRWVGRRVVNAMAPRRAGVLDAARIGCVTR